jgi:hypothetical protein
VSVSDVETVFDTAKSFKFGREMDATVQTRTDTTAARETASGTTIVLDQNGLTPGMRHACVAPVSEALDTWREHKDAFETAIRPYRKELDALDDLESEIAALKADMADVQDRTMAQARADQRYADAERELTAADQQYDKMYTDHGQRHAKAFPRAGYAAILVAIGAVEWLVNYDAFLANFGVPAMAAGFTIAVAMIVAAASHTHGEILKQRHHHFGDHVESHRKTTKLIWVALMTFGLLAAFGFVAWNRFTWGMDLLASAGGAGAGNLLGESVGPQINVQQKVAMSVIANVIVWLIGVAVAYWVHDADPEFTTALRRKRAAQKRFDRLHKPWARRIKQTIAELDKKIAAKANTAVAQHERGRHLRDMRDQIAAHDTALQADARARIARYLENYKYLLTAAAAQEGVAFNMGGEILDARGYQACALTVDPAAQLIEAA